MFIDIHTHQNNSNYYCIVNTQPQKNITFPTYSCGLHPWYLDDAKEKLILLEQIIQQQNCIAIGECGLDKICDTNWNLQLDIFKHQILLANKYAKPIIIHCVKASNEIVNILNTENNKMPVIIHGFNQNKNILDLYLKNNFFISIGNNVLQNNSNALNAIENIPVANLFLETDDNKKLDIQEIYKAVASIKNISLKYLEEQIENNLKTIIDK